MIDKFLQSAATGVLGMKKAAILITVVGGFLSAVGLADGRNVKYLVPISAALESTDAGDKPDGSIKFFFDAQETPKIVAKVGSDAQYRKSTTRGTSDELACKRAFLSALVALEKRAKETGANAVVNIVSYFRKLETRSTTEFECHAGASAGVGLRGDFVNIAEQ
jgi:uncharacterized protein YbjQ (UPF0145 family)